MEQTDDAAAAGGAPADSTPSGAQETAAAPGDGTRPLAIAIVAPGPGAIGGQETQASTLEKLLREEGHQVARLPIDPPFPAPLAFLRGVPVARTALNQALYARSLLRLRRFDVVHVFSAAYWSFLLSPLPALLMGRLFRKRVVLNYHSGEADDHLARFGILVHPWLRLADALVVPSDYLRGVFAAHGYVTRVIPNVIETDRFAYRARQRLLPRCVVTRSLEPIYRVEVALRAFARLRGRFDDATLAVAGCGTEEARLKRLAADLGARGIHFLGRVSPEAMPDLLDRSDLYLNASVVDNQPMSILEAFASGLPVVSTAPGDLRHMLRDGQTGTVLEEGSPEEMAAAAERLLEAPESALRMAARARQVAESHAWAAVRGAWMDAYGLAPRPEEVH
jgi:glycosyltransferase involved in cell wall biosynthesis